MCTFAPKDYPEILELDASGTISILNRSVQVAADCTWLLSNVPSFMGQVRACATSILTPGVPQGI